MAKSSSLKTAPSLYYTRPSQICQDKIFYHEPGSNSKLQSKKFTLFLACLSSIGYSLYMLNQTLETKMRIHKFPSGLCYVFHSIPNKVTMVADDGYGNLIPVAADCHEWLWQWANMAR